jgi:multimeric flavodoxin WrbA
MTKVLLISGSPRKGNTDFILSTIYNKLDSNKELVFLKDKEIKHCIGCLNCHDKPQCIINDDMTEIRSKLIDADIIVIGTPNYFDNITGLLKDFVDRTHPFYKAESLKGKKLILIMVGGGKIEGTQTYLSHTMYGFVKYLKFNLVGSYCFNGLNQNDLKQNSLSILKIDEIIRKINSL